MGYCNSSQWWQHTEAECVGARVSDSLSLGGHISLTVAFKEPNVIAALYECSYSLTVK